VQQADQTRELTSICQSSDRISVFDVQLATLWSGGYRPAHQEFHDLKFLFWAILFDVAGGGLKASWDAAWRRTWADL